MFDSRPSQVVCFPFLIFVGSAQPVRLHVSFHPYTVSIVHSVRENLKALHKLSQLTQHLVTLRCLIEVALLNTARLRALASYDIVKS